MSELADRANVLLLLSSINRNEGRSLVDKLTDSATRAGAAGKSGDRLFALAALIEQRLTREQGV